VSEGWLGFLGGIVATLVAALIASVSQRITESRRRRDEARIDVYFHLLDLKNWYFWVASAEIRGEQPREEVLAECRRISYLLNDKLRSFEDVDHLDEILAILFSESIASANERANRLNSLLDRYGKLVSPRYQALARRIGDENLLRHSFLQAPSSNAPTTWSYRK
jgi:hypothetical protein